MNLLAFDTACDSCSVALWRDGGVVARRARAMARGQSEALVPMIGEVMSESGLEFSALSALAVTVGPGAFTGLRIGLASARAIGLAAARPVIGVSTFDAIAAAAARAARARARTLVIAIDTKRDDFYVQRFSLDGTEAGFAATGAPSVMRAEEAAVQFAAGDLLLAGDGASRLAGALTRAGRDVTALGGVTVPDAADVALVAARRFAAGAPLPPVRPLYLRPPAVRVAPPPDAGAAP